MQDNTFNADMLPDFSNEPEPPDPNAPIRPLVRVEHGDPNQCQATHAHIQCPYRAIGTRKPDNTWEGVQFCPRHGQGTLRTAARASTRMYMLSKFQARVETIAEHPKLKSLRDDIAILRMTLENKLNQCKDAADLEMRGGAIVELIRQIEKTVTAAHRLEKESNQLIDKTRALIWIKELIDIISTHVGSQEVLKNIGEDFLLATDKLFPNS